MKDPRGEEFGLPERRETRIGDRVRFAAVDVFLPGPGGASLIPEATEFDGMVVEFSDSGPRTRAFAVVEVVRKQMMVVPVGKLERIASPAGDEAQYGEDRQ
jgi:hypothetical protein